MDQEVASQESTSSSYKKDRKVRDKEPKRQDVCLPESVGQALKVPGQTKQLRLQPRLFMCRTNPPPLSLFQVIRQMKLPGLECETSAAGETITDDVRVQEVPKQKACALRVRSHARSGIRKAGARSSPWPSRPSAPPRAVAPFSPLVLAKAERCPGILQGPGNPARPR